MLKGNLEKWCSTASAPDSIVKKHAAAFAEGSGEHRPVDINADRRGKPHLAYHGARDRNGSGFNIRCGAPRSEAGLIDCTRRKSPGFSHLISKNGFYAATKRKEAGDETFEPTLSATNQKPRNRVEIRIRITAPASRGSKGENVQSLLHHQPAGRHRTWPVDSHDIVVNTWRKIDVDTMPGAFTNSLLRCADSGGSSTDWSHKLSVYILVAMTSRCRSPVPSAVQRDLRSGASRWSSPRRQRRRWFAPPTWPILADFDPVGHQHARMAGSKCCEGARRAARRSRDHDHRLWR